MTDRKRRLALAVAAVLAAAAAAGAAATVASEQAAESPAGDEQVRAWPPGWNPNKWTKPTGELK